MAPVSTICSLILALMMALSGGGNIAEIPEMMDVLTLRNVALEVEMLGEERRIEIPMEFQLASAVGAHDGALHFEIHDADGNVLLPISGKVLSDALQFAIGDSENAYGVYEQTLRDEMMLTETDEQLLDGMTGMLAYIVENEMLQNTDVQLSVMDIMRVLADQKQLDAEATTVYYGDNEYPAQKRSYTAAREEVDALLEAPPAGLSEADRQAVEAYAVMDSYYKLMEAAYDELLQDSPVNINFNFSDSVDVEITEAEVDGEAYRSVKQSYRVDNTDYEIEYVTHGKRTRVGQHNVTEYELDGEVVQNRVTTEQVYDGPLSAPETISMVGMVQTRSELEGFAAEEDVYFHISGGVTDGLWSVDGEMTMSAFNGWVGEEETYGYEIDMPFSYLETSEDDGSKTGHVDIGLNYADLLNMSFSFDLNMAEAPYADFFAGREVIWLDEMTEEQAIALEDEWTEALEAASVAFKAWSDEAGEALGLQTVQPAGEYIVYPDGSIEHVMYDGETAGGVNNSLRQSIRGKVLDDEVEYVDEYDYSDVYEEYDEEYVVPEYYSWAEAQAVFGTEIPNYIAPEKWPLRKIEMFYEDYMYASFGDDDDGFALDVSYYGDTGVERYALLEGRKLVPSNAITVDCYSEDGNIYWARFDYESCVMSIYFNGDATYADLEAVLAGFEF